MGRDFFGRFTSDFDEAMRKEDERDELRRAHWVRDNARRKVARSRYEAIVEKTLTVQDLIHWFSVKPNPVGVYALFRWARKQPDDLDAFVSTLIKSNPHLNSALCEIFINRIEPYKKQKASFDEWMDSLTSRPSIDDIAIFLEERSCLLDPITYD